MCSSDLADVLVPRADDEIVLPGAERSESLRLDLVRLADLQTPEATAISRYASAIQVRRGDYAGKVITLRRDDLTVLASVLGTTTGALVADLEAQGLVVPR